MKSNKKPIISQTKELKNSLIKEVKKRSTTKELDSVTIKQKSSFMFNRSKTLRIDDLLKTNTAYCKSTIKSKAITNDIEKMPTELHPKKDNKIQDFEVEKKIEELSGKIAKIKEVNQFLYS